MQNLMLQELQQQSEDFCRDQLALFYQQFELKNEQLSAIIDRDDTNNSLRSFVLEKRNNALYERFESAFLTALTNTQVEFNNFINQHDTSRPVTNLLDRVIESELALPNMIMAADRRCELELNDLHRRLSVISQIKITADRNPFTPLSYAHAFEQAILSLHWNMQTRILAFRLFETTVLRQLHTLYEGMNRALSKKGILPNLRAQGEDHELHRMDLEDQQKSHAKVQDAHGATTQGETFIENIGPTGEVLVAGIEIRAAANDALQEKHIRAIESVGQNFNDLLSHEAITPSLKSLLSRLYSPYVRLALADDTVAENPDHPAQRLLACLTKALELYHNSDAPLQRPTLLLQIKSLVEQLSSDSELKPRVFSELAFRFSAELRHHDRLVNAQLDKRKRCQTGIRQLDSLRQNIRRIIAAKLDDTDLAVSPFVTEFLLETWTQYTTSLFASPTVEQEKSEHALAIVERILNYSAGKPHSTGDEFTELAPELRNGILACGGENHEVRHFLQQLMHQHKHPIKDAMTLRVRTRKTAMEAAGR